MTTLVVAMMAGAGILAGVNSYKDSKIQKSMQTSQQVAGKASVGGAFQLIDTEGRVFSDQDLLGEFALLYFGFTFCPDICPDELEKVAEVVDLIEKQTAGVVKVRPVFISVDPERDTPSKVKEYVREFHPRMIGLTGDIESVKKVSKQYRVYFSKTGEQGATDYLVDHSIIHYLVNPAGEFVTFYSKSNTAEQFAASVLEHVAQWKEGHEGTYHPGNEIKVKKTA